MTLPLDTFLEVGKPVIVEAGAACVLLNARRWIIVVPDLARLSMLALNSRIGVVQIGMTVQFQLAVLGRRGRGG